VVLAAGLAWATAGCTVPLDPVGIRATPDGQVEAYYRSCDGSAVSVEVTSQQRQAPAPTTGPHRTADGSSGTTVAPSVKTTVWSGELPGDRGSIVAPVHPQADLRYGVEVWSRRTGRTSVGFTLEDLSADGVVFARGSDLVSVSVEEWHRQAEERCDKGPGRVLRAAPILFLAGGVMVVPVLVLALALVVHRIRGRRRAAARRRARR
jgi:hypothetical protein